MSKVFIEGMDMPKSCEECRLVYRHVYNDSRYLCCLLDPSTGNCDINYYTNGRHPCCPLKECK